MDTGEVVYDSTKQGGHYPDAIVDAFSENYNPAIFADKQRLQNWSNSYADTMNKALNLKERRADITQAITDIGGRLQMPSLLKSISPVNLGAGAKKQHTENEEIQSERDLIFPPFGR